MSGAIQHQSWNLVGTAPEGVGAVPTRGARGSDRHGRAQRQAGECLRKLSDGAGFSCGFFRRVPGCGGSPTASKENRSSSRSAPTLTSASPTRTAPTTSTARRSPPASIRLRPASWRSRHPARSPTPSARRPTNWSPSSPARARPPRRWQVGVAALARPTGSRRSAAVGDSAHRPSGRPASRRQRGRLETARRLRSTIGGVFRYAIATARAETDPTTALRGALTTPTVTPRAAVTDGVALGALLRAIETYDGQPTTRTALQLMALLFPRPGELRAAEWTEFDLDIAIWSIPATRTKMRRPHRAPLPHQAVALLRDLQAITGRGRLAFPRTPHREGEVSRQVGARSLRSDGPRASISVWIRLGGNIRRSRARDRRRRD